MARTITLIPGDGIGPEVTESVVRIFKVAGLDMTALRACLTSDKMLPLIQADREKGVTGGVRATPSFFIGNQLLEGVQSAADLRRVLDTALANAR